MKKSPSKNGIIRRLFGISSSLSMSKEDLEALTSSITGKVSLSDLTIPEGMKVIKKLEEIQTRTNRKLREQSRARGVVKIADYRKSQKQERMVKNLLSQINQDRPKVNLDSMCQRTWGRPYEKLDRVQTISLIDVLIEMNGRIQK